MAQDTSDSVRPQFLHPMEGLRLSELIALGAVEPADAIALVRDVASSVARLHEAGHAHGAIHPDNVHVPRPPSFDGAGLASAPTSDRACWSPKRLRDSRRSLDDDIWALHVLLLQAMRRSAATRPLSMRVAKREARKVEDPSVRRLLFRYFETGHGGASALAAELAAWKPSAADSRAPRNRPRSAAFAVALLLVGGFAIWNTLLPPANRLISQVRQSGAAGTRAPSPSAGLSAAKSRVRTSAVAPPSPHLVSDCLAAALLGDKNMPRQDLAFVCSADDHRTIVARVQRAIVRSTKGRATAVADTWARLLWHQHAWVALAQQRCCRPAPPVVLPAPAGQCSALGPVLESLAAQAVDGSDLERQLEEFERGAACMRKSAPGTYPYRDGPLAGGGVVFRALIAKGQRAMSD